MRYFLEFCYLGTAYNGFQIQPNAPSVQAEINRCISTILQEEILTAGSSRTDTGVHARHQTLHFDTTKAVPENMVYKLNALAPNDISFLDITRVEDDFHSRFAATFRAYEYVISRRKDPFLAEQSYPFWLELDIDLMNKGAEIILAHTDFEAFSKVHTDVATFDCAIEEAKWTVDGHLLKFNIRANRFLRGMVRAIVGTLLDVGQKKISTEDVKTILESKDRSNAGRSAPAKGLFLTEVGYPPIKEKS